jgi:hypothetical protein
VEDAANEQVTCRGFSNVTVIDRHTGRWLPEGQRSFVLLDGENKTIQYPVAWGVDEFSGTLQYLMGSRQVLVEGGLFNYTAWNGERYQVLRLTAVSIYSVRYDPTPLSPSQVRFSTGAG